MSTTVSQPLVPAHIALLMEARDFGQFDYDISWTQARPVVEAMAKLLDEVYEQYYNPPKTVIPEGYEQLAKFYDVGNVHDLLAAQERHVRKLQEKLMVYVFDFSPKQVRA